MANFMLRIFCHYENTVKKTKVNTLAILNYRHYIMDTGVFQEQIPVLSQSQWCTPMLWR